MTGSGCSSRFAWPSVRAVNGVVREFDEAKGYGMVESVDGDRYFFHCTQIADGSRTVPLRAKVRFEVRPWHRGQREAVQIAPR